MKASPHSPSRQWQTEPRGSGHRRPRCSPPNPSAASALATPPAADEPPRKTSAQTHPSSPPRSALENPRAWSPPHCSPRYQSRPALRWFSPRAARAPPASANPATARPPSLPRSRSEPEPPAATPHSLPPASPPRRPLQVSTQWPCQSPGSNPLQWRLCSIKPVSWAERVRRASNAINPSISAFTDFIERFSFNCPAYRSACYSQAPVSWPRPGSTCQLVPDPSSLADNHHSAGSAEGPPAPGVGVITSLKDPCISTIPRNESPNHPVVRLRRTQPPAEPKETTNELQLSELRLHTGRGIARRPTA